MEVADHVEVGADRFDHVAAHDLHVVHVEQEGDVRMAHVADNGGAGVRLIEEVSGVVDEGVQRFEHERYASLGREVSGRLEAVDDALPLHVGGSVRLHVARTRDHHRGAKLPAAS